MQGQACSKQFTGTSGGSFGDAATEELAVGALTD
jgi:hypothetical protein